MTNNKHTNEEVVQDPQGIEGMDDIDSSWPDYPIDTLLIRNESRTVHDVLRRIEKKQFIMDPDFQRDFIWDDEKQSKLIESVLMRIPLPVFYLAEDNKGKMIVVDGLQRLSTFENFVNNKLRLKLPYHSQLNKKYFKDLLPKLQNRIEDCNLTLYIIDSKVPQKALLDIFDRVNGGVPLTRQQMRNCLFSGRATTFLKDESKTEIFLKATGESLQTRSMRDREMINRFCAFRLYGYEDYKDDMDDFLAKALEKMNSSTPEELNRLANEFRNSLKNNYLVFERHSFRKIFSNAQTNRSMFNASLWDVMTIGLMKYSTDNIESNAENIRLAFYELMGNENFLDSITLGTGQSSRVKLRFDLTRKMFKEVLGDPPA